MSEQLSFDRRKGFVALPVEIMDFDLTPGAFRTLAELCRMANSDGFCWPSLHQLSERLGRSRSAISGYIKELRSAGLVDTEEQKTANGYNYRLKYRVTFWQEWRAGLRGRTQPEDERGVQPAARKTQSKNQSHKNHSPGESSTDLEPLLAKWATTFAGAPYPLVRHRPDQSLIEMTRDILNAPQSDPPAPNHENAVRSLWQRLGVTVGDAHIRQQLQVLLDHRFTPSELDQALMKLARDWPSHWRKPPEPTVFRKLLKATMVTSRQSKLAVLRSYHKRWELAEKTLQKRSGSCSVKA